MKGKTIIIIGGGSGGVAAAHELRAKLGREHRVILIDKNASHIFYPSLLWVIFGWREPEQIQFPLDRLKRKGIEFICGEVTEIKPAEHTIKVNRNNLSYDYLILSPGAELVPESLPKSDVIFNLYSLESAKLINEKINNFSGGKIIILISSLPFKCPAAPYEAALLLDYFFRNRKMRNKIDIQIFTPEILPMATAGPGLANAVRQMVEGQGIGFNPGLKLLSIDEKKQELKFDQNRTGNFDLLLVVPQHRAPEALKKSGLTGETGWVSVEPKTLLTNNNGIYAIGDVAAIKLPNGKMLPKAGVFAHNQAKVAAHNISVEINNTGVKKEFSGSGSCFLEMGYGKAGYASGNFYAVPEPAIKLYKPGRIWHLGKILFEKWWSWKYF